MTNSLDLFSPGYHAAASRFREAAARIGAHLTRHAIRENTEEPPLTMDVARIGSARIGFATPRQSLAPTPSSGYSERYERKTAPTTSVGRARERSTAPSHSCWSASARAASSGGEQ